MCGYMTYSKSESLHWFISPYWNQIMFSNNNKKTHSYPPYDNKNISSMIAYGGFSVAIILAMTIFTWVLQN